MPHIQALPTWLAWNNCNFTSPTGLTDQATGQQFSAGGLNLGDYFDADNQAAATASFITNGILYGGRYRLVQVDSGATAANVKTGTIGYLRAGSTVKTAITLTAGTGQNNGSFQIAANVGSGGGSGAIIQVVIAGGLIVGNPAVINGGFNYVTAPTFAIGQGGTPGTVQVQLDSTPNRVTSYDIGVPFTGTVRPVVFLNAITPGNYGFVQELGCATVLGAAAVGDNTIGDWVDSAANGLAVARVATASPIGATIGRAIDPAQNNSLFKIYLTNSVAQD